MEQDQSGVGGKPPPARSAKQLKAALEFGDAGRLSDRELLFIVAHYLQALYRLAVYVLVVVVAAALLLWLGLQSIEDNSGF